MDGKKKLMGDKVKVNLLLGYLHSSFSGILSPFQFHIRSQKSPNEGCLGALMLRFMEAILSGYQWRMEGKRESVRTTLYIFLVLKKKIKKTCCSRLRRIRMVGVNMK